MFFLLLPKQTGLVIQKPQETVQIGHDHSQHLVEMEAAPTQARGTMRCVSALLCMFVLVGGEEQSMSRWVENCEMVEQTQVIRSGLLSSWEKKTTARAFSRAPHALSPTNPTTSMQSVSAHAMLPCPRGCAKGGFPGIRNRFCRSTRLHIHHNPGATVPGLTHTPSSERAAETSLT